MMALRLLALLLGTLAWTKGAPYHQGYDHYDQLRALGDETEQFQQNQEHEDILGNLQQQYQSEDLQQFQQNPFLEEHLPAHLEDFSQHAQRLEQNHENDDYVQQPQALNLERFPEPHGQLRETIPEEDDTQQFQPIEFNQYQQGPLPEVPQSGRLEIGHDDVQIPQGHETHLREFEQQSQSEDLSQYTQQQDQMGRLIDETHQIQDHDSFIDDTQQQSQVEDLTQFQQGRITNEQQSGRLEDLGHDVDIMQQTQEKQIADLADYPEQIGQIRVQDEETQQTQDHDSFIDDSHQQSQVEDLTQFQQGRIEQQIGRLEDLGEHTDTQQQNTEKLIEDYDHEGGQQRQDVYAENYADLHGGLQQETQNEDLSAFSIGQFRAEPNVEPLAVSQVRHEQNEFSFNAPNFAAKVESEDIGLPSQDNQEEHYMPVNEEIHQQAPAHSLNSELSDFELEKHVPTKPTPGFWKRLGSKIESAYEKVGSKIESAYEKAKAKGKHVIHSITENLG